MKVHAIASSPHLLRHIDAVWDHLPEELKGSHQVGRQVAPYRFAIDDLVLVGGYSDVQHVTAAKRRCVYIEHGAGQSYVDASRQARPYYSGGPHPPNVIGYVVPRVEVGERWRRPYVVAGCPALERIVRVERPQPVAAITFHWDAVRVCPEARSARPYYISHLWSLVYNLRNQGYRVIGHWHPRDPAGEHAWRHLNVEREQDIDTVLGVADVLILDNSSAGYEAAALGISTVWLNAPWYRRDVHHGLRFWDRVPGPQVDLPEDLLIAPPELFTQKPDPEMMATVYEPGDGRKAADWIVALIS